jgi:hypothetical protein
MKTFTLLKKISFFVFALTALFTGRLMAQTASISPLNPSVAVGGSVNFTATASNFEGSARHYTWTVSPTTGVTPAPPITHNTSSNTDPQTFTFNSSGTFTVTVAISDNEGNSSNASTTVTVSGPPPPPSVTLSPSGSQNVLTGGSISFTATALNYPAGGNYTYTWTITGVGAPAVPGANPNTIAASSDTKNITFPTAGTYTVYVNITRAGTLTNLTTAPTTVNVYAPPSSPNLWAASSGGTQISSFTVTHGLYVNGPNNMFVPTFPGTTTGGTSTAALGKYDVNPSTGYFYWLPNTSGNNGVVEVYASTSVGGSQTLIGTTDVNGASNSSLGFVRLGMGPDGTGWILAGDGTNLYLAYFLSNGVNPVTINTKPVTIVGGSVSTFLNGDVCISGNNNMYALANDGSGLTQIYIGSVSNPTVTLTQKWNLVDQNNVAFTGTVNGDAFDLQGSLYISTGTGLYFIDQNTVNGPAGTVQCSLVWAGSGLTDLATSYFPMQSLLPVKIEFFKGDLRNGNVNLSWKTSSENNIEFYTVQRSLNGTDFTDVGSLPAAGSGHEYSFVDPVSGNPSRIYYRLKISENTSGYSYSSVVLIKLDQKTGSVIVSPNPFKDKVQFTINSNADANMTYSLVGLDGKQIRTGSNKISKGSNTFFVNGLEQVQPGIYMLRIQIDDEARIVKLVKD